jgi:hypothetical protein
MAAGLERPAYVVAVVEENMCAVGVRLVRNLMELSDRRCIRAVAQMHGRTSSIRGDAHRPKQIALSTQSITNPDLLAFIKG